MQAPLAGEGAQGAEEEGSPTTTVSARGAGTDALQVRVAVSPGEGGRGKRTSAAPSIKGQEATREAGAPGSGAPP